MRWSTTPTPCLCSSYSPELLYRKTPTFLQELTYPRKSIKHIESLTRTQRFWCCCEPLHVFSSPPRWLQPPLKQRREPSRILCVSNWSSMIYHCCLIRSFCRRVRIKLKKRSCRREEWRWGTQQGSRRKARVFCSLPCLVVRRRLRVVLSSSSLQLCSRRLVGELETFLFLQFVLLRSCC